MDITSNCWALSMEEILHRLISGLSNYLHGRISSMNSMSWVSWDLGFVHQTCWVLHLVSSSCERKGALQTWGYLKSRAVIASPTGFNQHILVAEESAHVFSIDDVTGSVDEFFHQTFIRMDWKKSTVFCLKGGSDVRPVHELKMTGNPIL